MNLKHAMILPNGATLIAWAPAGSQAKDGDIVLAVRDQSPHPYVTWWMNAEGDTFHGHYIETLEEAMSDFKSRMGKGR